MKHRISQLDGQFDCEVNSTDSEKNPCPLCPEECGLCENWTCEECEYIATEEGFAVHIMNGHDPKVVFKHFGQLWIHANMKSISRDLQCYQDRLNIQKWENFISCLTAEGP